MADLSVIIYAHEARKECSRRVLEALQTQSLPQCQWELLLIDRGSKRSLRPTWDLSWHSQARHVIEDKDGPALNLQSRVCEAATNLLVFLDENSVLNFDFLSEAVRISQEWPRLGLWGSGAIGLEFEATPPKRLEELALITIGRRFERAQCSNVFICTEAAPIGAGLCVRPNVAAAYGRSQKRSEEINIDPDENFALNFAAREMSYHACNLGLGMGVFPQLKLSYLISSACADERKLLTQREHESVLRNLLNFDWKGIKPPDPLSSLSLLSTLRGFLLERGAPRRLHFADLRARLKARNILAANKSALHPL